MFCKKCGAQLDEGNIFCPNCGAHNLDDAAQYNINFGEPKGTPAKYSAKAIVAFVVSLVGILVFPLPCGIVGLIFSCFALGETKTPKYRGQGLAISGLVLSIIDVIWGIFYLLISLI